MSAVQTWVSSLGGRLLPGGPCFRAHRLPRQLVTCPGPPTSGLCADCPACWEGCPAHSPGPHCESPPLRGPPRLSSGPTLCLSSGPGHCLPGHPVLIISKHFFQFSFHCFFPSPHRCARPVRTGAWFWNVHSGREEGRGPF